MITSLAIILASAFSCSTHPPYSLPHPARSRPSFRGHVAWKYDYCYYLAPSTLFSSPAFSQLLFFSAMREGAWVTRRPPPLICPFRPFSLHRTALQIHRELQSDAWNHAIYISYNSIYNIQSYVFSLRFFSLDPLKLLLLFYSIPRRFLQLVSFDIMTETVPGGFWLRKGAEGGGSKRCRGDCRLTR